MKTTNIFLTGALLLLVVLVLFKSIDHHHFRNDAGKWAEKSIQGSNVITAQELNQLTGNKLLIALDTESATDNSISIAPQKILEKENFKKFSRFEGNVILISQKPSDAARIWMLLSQMGIKHLYVLAI